MTRAIFEAADLGLLPVVVARMGDGSDHEACRSERERGVVMAFERAAGRPRPYLPDLLGVTS